jgi:hypothetical protein
MPNRIPVPQRRLAAIAASLVLIGACSTPGDWVKPGADAATTDRDYARCTHLAMRDAPSALTLEEEPLGSRFGSLPRVDPSAEDPGTDPAEPELRAIRNRCLASRGYAPAPRQ